MLDLGLNDEDFLGVKVRIGTTDLKSRLVSDSPYKGSASRLLKSLLKASLKQEICEICGQSDEWQGKKLKLQLHHKNGDNQDNRLENLQIICPNCHTQTDNYAGRATKK